MTRWPRASDSEAFASLRYAARAATAAAWLAWVAIVTLVSWAVCG